jgi:hypothetical protein
MLLVTFENSAVILPDFSSPPDLYNILSQKWGKGRSINFTGQPYIWPDKAVMALDNHLLKKKITQPENTPDPKTRAGD